MAQIMVSPIYPVSSDLPPRQIIAEDFKSMERELPIAGGWGYTRDDAVIIDKNDPSVDPKLPFDGVSIEYLFVEKRIYEELIIFRPEGEKFSGIRWNQTKQELIKENGQYFDHLELTIMAFPEKDWEELKSEWEGPNGHGTLGFDEEAHIRKREECMITLKRDFWFDITSFYKA